jgi:hypothetical protein
MLNFLVSEALLPFFPETALAASLKDSLPFSSGGSPVKQSIAAARKGTLLPIITRPVVTSAVTARQQQRKHPLAY